MSGGGGRVEFVVECVMRGGVFDDRMCVVLLKVYSR